VTYVECSAGKYYWKETDPTEFYACVEPSHGVNPLVSDYVVNAVKMRCTSGTYMCTRHNDVSDFFTDVYFSAVVFTIRYSNR